MRPLSGPFATVRRPGVNLARSGMPSPHIHMEAARDEGTRVGRVSRQSARSGVNTALRGPVVGGISVGRSVTRGAGQDATERLKARTSSAG